MLSSLLKELHPQSESAHLKECNEKNSHKHAQGPGDSGFCQTDNRKHHNQLFLSLGFPILSLTVMAAIFLKYLQGFLNACKECFIPDLGLTNNQWIEPHQQFEICRNRQERQSSDSQKGRLNLKVLAFRYFLITKHTKKKVRVRWLSVHLLI